MDVQQVLAWSIFLGIVLVMLAIDLLVLHRKPHAIHLREALLGAMVPMVAALGFAGAIYFAYDRHFLNLGLQPAGMEAMAGGHYPHTGSAALLQFVTGYLVELSLSADNVFLFVILMSFFKVPRELQHRVLFWGVLGALVMRGVMILMGAALLARFHWIIYVFGGFLLLTGFRMFFHSNEPADPSNTVAVKIAKKLLPFKDGFDGKNFFTVVSGKRMATTLFLVLVCIEFTDLVFALDSIPAIFGITMDTFIVFTSNVFAILGLRSMYFLLAGVMDKFHLLRYGLAAVLAFVGMKMLLPAAGEVYARMVGSGEAYHWDIDQMVSLGFIVTALVVSVVASLVFPCKTHHHNPLEEDAPEGTASPSVR